MLVTKTELNYPVVLSEISKIGCLMWTKLLHGNGIDPKEKTVILYSIHDEKPNGIHVTDYSELVTDLLDKKRAIPGQSINDVVRFITSGGQYPEKSHYRVIVSTKDRSVLLYIEQGYPEQLKPIVDDKAAEQIITTVFGGGWGMTNDWVSLSTNSPNWFIPEIFKLILSTSMFPGNTDEFTHNRLPSPPGTWQIFPMVPIEEMIVVSQTDLCGHTLTASE